MSYGNQTSSIQVFNSLFESDRGISTLRILHLEAEVLNLNTAIYVSTLPTKTDKNMAIPKSLLDI